MSRRIVTSVRAATIGSLTPSTQTLVRWPSPRSSPTSGSKAKIRSDRTNLPKPSETIRGSDATNRSCQPARRHATRDSHLPPAAAEGAMGRFAAQASQRPPRRRNQGSFHSTTGETFTAADGRSRPIFPNSQRKAPRISYCDGVSDHYDPRSSSTTRRFSGDIAVSRALIITSDHICHILHSINSGQEST
jgi:hypothetical protein